MKEKSYNIKPAAEPFRYEGTRPNLLLIHGFTASPTEVKPLGKYLNENYGFDVHSVLLAGHGTHPTDLQQTTWQDWWKSAENKLNSMEKCDFVLGLSMGGLLAGKLAAEYDAIKGLILMSTPMGLQSKVPSILLPVIKLFKPYIYKNNSTKEYFNKHNLCSYDRYPVSAIQQLLKLMKHTKQDILPKIEVPALIAQGKRDTTIVPDSCDIISNKIKTSKRDKEIVLLPNSGHIITVELDKDKLFRKVGKFVKNYT